MNRHARHAAEQNAVGAQVRQEMIARYGSYGAVASSDFDGTVDMLLAAQYEARRLADEATTPAERLACGRLRRHLGRQLEDLVRLDDLIAEELATADAP